MDIKDIKEGETYLLPVTVNNIGKNGWLAVATCHDYGYSLAPTEVKTLIQNGTKNTETAPKYDQNRLFRKGDKVEVVKNKGRLGSSTLPIGTRATVERDEEECDWVFLKADDCDKIDTVDAAYLKLVTPVEELDMYYVEHHKHSNAYTIRKGGQEFAIFWDIHPHANEAAEAECARLNAEYRKEDNHA